MDRARSDCIARRTVHLVAHVTIELLFVREYRNDENYTQ